MACDRQRVRPINNGPSTLPLDTILLENVLKEVKLRSSGVQDRTMLPICSLSRLEEYYSKDIVKNSLDPCEEECWKCKNGKHSVSKMCGAT
jgi:hypothetical protein